MKKLEDNPNFDVINNPDRFVDLYSFQNLLDNKYDRKFYIDSSDLISVIKGIHNFIDVTNSHQFKITLFNSKMTLIHAFIYNGYLGEVNLLNSHIFEFYESLNSLKNVTLPILQFSQTIDDIRFKLKLNDKILNSGDLKKIKEKLDFGEIKNQSVNRFKINYLFKDLTPKERTINLNNKNIVNFSSDKNFSIQNNIDSIFFKKAFAALNSLKSDRTDNNFIDALALCQLNEELNKFKKLYINKKAAKLPIMYGRKKLIEAALILSLDKELRINQEKPFILNTLEGEYLIIQPEDFFIVDVLYNFKKVESADNESFERFYNEYIKYSYDPIQTTARKAIHLAFFEKWWEKNGLSDLISTLNVINNLKLDNAYKEFDFVKKEFDFFYNNLKNDVLKISFGLEFIIKIFNKKWDHSLYKKHNKNGDLQYDVDHEFTTRFAYSINNVESLKKYIQDIYDSFKNLDKQQNIKFDIFTTLHNGLELTSKNKTKEIIEKIMIFLAILWIENEFALIDVYCEALRLRYNPADDKSLDYYPNYQIALIHCAALILNNQQYKDIDYLKVEKILFCINSKCKENSFKCQISQAFIYSKLWEYLSLNASIPEISIFTNNYSKEVLLKRVQYYEKSKGLALKAYENILKLLKNNKNKEYVDQRYLEKLKYYSINVYIYMEVLNADIMTFKEQIGDKIDTLQSIIDPNINHERYLDTIARYHQRNAAKIAILNPKNNGKFKSHLNFAIDNIREALKLAKGNNNKSDYALFNSLLRELQLINIEGRSYFKRNIDLTEKLF